MGISSFKSLSCAKHKIYVIGMCEAPKNLLWIASGNLSLARIALSMASVKLTHTENALRSALIKPKMPFESLKGTLLIQKMAFRWPQ